MSDSIDPSILRTLVEGTASGTGEQFFDLLVEHVARALGVKCAWVTEWLPEERRLNALAMWLDGRHVDEYNFAVDGTPCEPVIEKKELVHFPDRVIELFPDDPDLRPLGAVSYLGVPLFDTNRTMLGHLAVLHDEPMAHDPAKLDVFRIFAGRAAAELRRLRRDSDLRSKQQRIARLFNSAMDAIIELDETLTVTRVNNATEQAFGLGEGELVGRSATKLFRDPSGLRLARLADTLSGEDGADQSLWISDGLVAEHATDGPFDAEATLSCCTEGGKPIYVIILRNVSERAAAQARIQLLTDEAEFLRREVDRLEGFDEIIGESGSLREVLVAIDQVAPGDTTVLITGETGTGKELLARAIHQRSSRADRAMIKVNCAAIPATLQESEFFGHEKGAFTGATARREGRFKLAHAGTIFLDEVGELPLDLQAKLLRVLQEGEYEPVGSSRTERVDVRVVAATNRDLEGMVASGGFRKDLFYRLSVFPIAVPALRDREDDVVLLAEMMTRNLAASRGPVPRLTPDDHARLRRYPWPGNVRELQNVIERAILTSTTPGRLNLGSALPESSPSRDAPVPPARVHRVLTDVEMRDVERENIRRALDEAGGKISGPGGAAELLGLNANTLTSRIRKLGINSAG